MLDGIRRATMPASRTARATLLGVVAMATLIVGLLAMHATGSTSGHSAHVAPASTVDPAASTSAGHAAHAPDASTGATAAAPADGLGDVPADPGACALMMLGCVMLAAAAALLVAAAPGCVRAIARAIGLAVEHVRGAAPPRPPSLIALSISRT